MAVNGTDIMLYINGQPVYAGVTNDENITNDLREVTSKLSGGNAEYEYGKFSFSGTAEGLFVEQPVNILRFSEDFSEGAWEVSGLTNAANFASAPNGRKVAGRATSVTVNGFISQEVPGYNDESIDVNFSLWLKGTAGQTVTIEVNDGVSPAASLAITLTANFVRYSLAYTTSGTSTPIVVSIIRLTGQTATSFDYAQPQLSIGTALKDYKTSGVLYSALFDAIKTKTPVQIKTGSNKSGSYMYSGTALISELSRTESVEDNTVFSLSYQGTGTLTETEIT